MSREGRGTTQGIVGKKPAQKEFLDSIEATSDVIEEKFVTARQNCDGKVSHQPKGFAFVELHELNSSPIFLKH